MSLPGNHRENEPAARRRRVSPPLGHDHTAEDHQVAGAPEEQARSVIARHLCGWIGGHGAIAREHFEADADLIMDDLRSHGLCMRFAEETA